MGLGPQLGSSVPADPHWKIKRPAALCQKRIPESSCESDFTADLQRPLCKV